MPKVPPHSHPCQDCGVKTECGGTWEENYDGFPEVICREWHHPNGGINGDFVCDECYEKREFADRELRDSRISPGTVRVYGISKDDI